MFISIKSKVSSILMNTVTLAILILVSYLAKPKHIVVLYQQYQQADRFDGYLGELEEVITCTDRLQRGVVGGARGAVQHRAEGIEGEPEH